MYRKHQNQYQQYHHHDFTDFFNTILKSLTANYESQHYRYSHPSCHLQRRRQQITKYPAYRICTHACREHTCCKFKEITEHPSRYGGVIHHQHITAQHTEPSVNMPLTARFFQCLIGQYGTLTAASSNSQFHSQYRHSHDKQEDQV